MTFHSKYIAMAFMMIATASFPLQRVAFAQEFSEAHLAAAQELMKVTGVDKQFDTLIPALMQQMTHLLITQNPKEEQLIRTLQGRITQRFATDKQNLLDQAAVIYAKHFTQEEIREVSAFYKTGVGERFVQATPEIMAEMMPLGQRWGREIAEKVIQEMQLEAQRNGVQLRAK
jgi:uncharacterized protein